MTKSGAERLLQMGAYGFWMRTKLAPHRAVRWEDQAHEDGRQSFRGKNWVEMVPYGTDREPERFFTADVEAAGPHEYMDYYPAVHEPVCGWMVAGGKYCPRGRAVEEDGARPFCPKHQAELEGKEERNLSGEDQSGAGGEPVPPAE